MKLDKFIRELEKIEKSTKEPNKVEVKMADCISVVKPIFKNNIVFITDVDKKQK